MSEERYKREAGSDDLLFATTTREQVMAQSWVDEDRLAAEEDHVSRNPTPDDPGKDYPDPKYKED